MVALLTVMGLGTQERFAENDVVVGRDADGVFFATCPEHVVKEVVVREGESADAPVVWRGELTGNGSRILRAEPSSQDYEIEGGSLSEVHMQLSIASFKIDSGVAAIPAYVTFNPTSLGVGMATTGTGELVSLDSWRADCGS